MSIALITGASRGLGRTIATTLAQSGINVLLVARDVNSLASVAAQLNSIAPATVATTFEADLTDDASLERLITAVKQRGGIDILINNAAIQGPIGPTWDLSPSDFDQTVKLNFVVPAKLCMALIPTMHRRGAGWIVNISGGGASGPRPMFSAYGAAKTALVRFSETLAAEAASIGIRVNAIAPGAFNSEMTRSVLRAGTIAGDKELSSARKLALDDGSAVERAAALVRYLVSGPGRDVSGKFLSAVWDDWQSLHLQVAPRPDDYTLRRMTPTTKLG